MSVPKHLKRQASIDSDAVDEESRRVSLAFSSEEPVDRAFGTEILDHDAASVDLSRLNNSAPLLLNHDPDRQIGVVQRAWIDDDDKRGRAVVRFSKSALGTEILNDVVDGVRELVSVSYSVEQWNRSKGKAKEADTLRAVRFLGYPHAHPPWRTAAGHSLSIRQPRHFPAAAPFRQVMPLLHPPMQRHHFNDDMCALREASVVRMAVHSLHLQHVGENAFQVLHPQRVMPFGFLQEPMVFALNDSAVNDFVRHMGIVPIGQDKERA